MENRLFREKTIDRISSPESLTDYIKVTTPSIWVILAAVVLLLVGVCVWGIFGRLTTGVKTIVISTGESMYAIVEDSDAQLIEIGDAVNVGERTYLVAGIGRESVELTQEASSYLLHIFGKTDSCWVVLLQLSDSYALGDGVSGQDVLGEGTYEGEVIIDSVSPMSFVVN